MSASRSSNFPRLDDGGASQHMRHLSIASNKTATPGGDSGSSIYRDSSPKAQDSQNQFVDLGEGGQPLRYVTKTATDPHGSSSADLANSPGGGGRIRSLFGRKKSIKNLRATSTVGESSSFSEDQAPTIPSPPRTLRGEPQSAGDQQDNEMVNIAPRGPPVSQWGIRDDLDQLAYGYSLKVAYINRVLQAAVAPQPIPQRKRSSTSLASGSPQASYFPTLPDPTTPDAAANFSNTTQGGSKSGFRRKSTIAEAKLPKEFLPTFWTRLDAEAGDVIWKSAVNTLLSSLPNKKATKTSSGLNLREIPTLLECFSESIPDNASGVSSTSGGHYARRVSQSAGAVVSKHTHIEHFTSFLSKYVDQFYSSGHKKLDDKDKEMYARIRLEFENYSLSPSAKSEAQPFSGLNLSSPASSRGSFSSSPSDISPFDRSPYATDVTTPSASSKPGTPALSRVPTNVSQPGSPSPSVDMIDVVRRVFGVSQEMLARDVDGLKRAGLSERSYLSDLREHLSAISNQSEARDSAFLRQRAKSLQAEMAALMQARPDLASSLPTAPAGSKTGSDLYFTPNQSKDDIYVRLTQRAHQVLGPETPLAHGGFGERELVELCAGIWAITAKSTREFHAVFALWEDANRDQPQSAGRSADGFGRSKATEAAWAKRVKEAITEIAHDAESGFDPVELPVVVNIITAAHDVLHSNIDLATKTIYPAVASQPIRPAPSVIAILSELYQYPSVTSTLPRSLTEDAWSELSDELRAHAVGEYVEKATQFLHEQSFESLSPEAAPDTTSNIDSFVKDPTMEGFEHMADWIEFGVRRVARAWPRPLLGGRLNPTGTILAKQLPLYLAELQVLDKPQEDVSGETIFGVYERTARLMSLWEDFCPGTPTDFDLDGFFEPYVLAWLRNAEEVKTHEWVTRAVAMDSWVPEGNLRHSQSVIDLFDFIRRAVSRLLTELPLGEYNRACYLIDFSRTASMAITQYAETVQSLFQSEVATQSGTGAASQSPAAVTGKASAWLAKSKQAVKSLERKKLEGFIVPPTACVKLTDMFAARACLEDLGYAMEAEETARIVKDHKLNVTQSRSSARDVSARYIFDVVVERGENLLGKGGNKPADAFVSVTDLATSNRLFKSTTIIGKMDPSWEEHFEISISGPRSYNVACYDRTLMGKHELIGSATFKLDPASFKETFAKDLVLPLSPNGTVTLRVEMEGGEKHDVRHYLSRAGKRLERAEQEMSRTIVNRMSEFLQSELSLKSIHQIIRPSGKKVPPSSQATVPESHVEASLSRVFGYLDTNFVTFSSTFSDDLRMRTMTLIWRRILDILIALLVPPLSDKESHEESLSGQEVNVVYQWLKPLKAFFNASEDGEEQGVPLHVLQAGQYKDLILIGQYLDLPTASLREKCAAAVRGTKRQLSAKPLGDSPTLSPSDSLASRRVNEDDVRLAEVLLRITRMRSGTAEFLAHQITLLNQGRAQRLNSESGL